MKIKDRNQRHRSPGRILLYALIALAVLTAGAVPLYRALSQANAEGTIQAALSPDSVSARLDVNPDGSVNVSFRGVAGAVYRVYYTDKLPVPTDPAAWTLLAGDVTASSGDWTDWLDTGAVTRPRPPGVKQGFYRWY